MSQRGATEHWLRDFAGNRFSTVLSESGGGLFERFGLMQFELALAVEGDSLALPVRGGRILGIPLPSKLLPVSISREFVVDGRFHFDVELLLPIVGLRIVRYQGWLTIDDACCSPR